MVRCARSTRTTAPCPSMTTTWSSEVSRAYVASIAVRASASAASPDWSWVCGSWAYGSVRIGRAFSFWCQPPVVLAHRRGHLLVWRYVGGRYSRSRARRIHFATVFGELLVSVAMTARGLYTPFAC